jgi:arginine decarboxylase
VTVRVDYKGNLQFTRELEGDSVADVLSYVEYDPKRMIQKIRALAEEAVQNDRISPKERRRIMDAYEDGMRGYTYFER